MRIHGYKLWALFKKDLKLSLKNKNIVAVLLLPILFCVLYTFMFEDMAEQMPSGFVLMLCVQMAICTIPITVMSMMIAEEKEKNTMRTLMLSDISGTEFLVSKALVCFVCTIVINIFIFVFSDGNLHDISIFLGISTAATISVTFFGAVVGICSKDQASASTLSTPIMILFLLPAVFAGFNEFFLTIAKLIPTYAFQELYTYHLSGSLMSMDALFPFVVIVGWGILGYVVFALVYKRNRLDN